MMKPVTFNRFIRFLQEELALSTDSIAIAERQYKRNPSHLPMVLWQYGLVTLEQLDRIFDWMESPQGSSN